MVCNFLHDRKDLFDFLHGLFTLVLALSKFYCEGD